MWGGSSAGNESHPSWQRQNNGSYMGPLTPVDLPRYWERLKFWSTSWESSIISLLLVKKMKMIIFPCPAKMLSVISCDYMDSERCAYLNTSGGHKLYKVNSLTIVLVPNCLIKGTFIWYWNMSDIAKIYMPSEQIITALQPYLPAWAGWNVCPSASPYWQCDVDTQSYFWK